MTIRRMDALPFFIGGGAILVFVLAVVLNWPEPWLPVGLAGCAFGAVVVLAYLDGPAVSLTVGPDTVVVANSFLRYDIPRARIVDLETLEYLTLKLVLEDGSRISVRVWEPAMRGVMSYRPRRAAGRMKPAVDLLRSTPAHGDDGRPVIRRLRLANVALALAPVLGALVCIVIAKA